MEFYADDNGLWQKWYFDGLVQDCSNSIAKALRFIGNVKTRDSKLWLAEIMNI